jgi:hypothetical protein
MSRISTNYHPWVEPAHPTSIRLFEELTGLYELIRKKYQKDIDQAFDNLSRMIGFVVTTTIPVSVEATKSGVVKSMTIAGDNLQETVFAKEFAPILEKIAADKQIRLSRLGSGRLYFIWFEALKLKLRTEWMEPAHYIDSGFGINESLRASSSMKFGRLVRPEVMEPAHWFRMDMPLEMEEAMVIAAIDEAYSELHLVDQIQAHRRSMELREYEWTKPGPGIEEPAHFRRDDLAARPDTAAKVLTEIAEVLKRHGF